MGERLTIQMDGPYYIGILPQKDYKSNVAACGCDVALPEFREESKNPCQAAGKFHWDDNRRCSGCQSPVDLVHSSKRMLMQRYREQQPRTMEQVQH